jgi:hypothetical protein
LFDNGLCNNVNDLPWQSFAVSSNVPLDLVAKEGCSSSENGDIVGVMDVCVGTSIVGDNVDESLGPPMKSQKPRQYFKKQSRKLCRKLDCRQTGDRKMSHFDHEQYRCHTTTNQDTVTPSVARSLSNQGHSPTNAKVKKMNQRLLDENHLLKKTSTKRSIISRCSLSTKRICYDASGLSQRPPTI